MKRGLVEWDAQEVPRSALDSRLGRVRAWGRQHGLDALAFHTSDSHTQPVRYLTHFLLYWNQGVLVVPCAEDAEAVLVYGLSGRVLDWVRRTSTVTQAVSARDLGGAVAALLAERGYHRVGVAEPEAFPAPVLGQIVGWTDASPVLAELGLDAVEAGLRATARQMCEDALARLMAGQTHRQAAAVFHGAARLAGAEDVSLFVGQPPVWPGLPGDASVANGAFLLARVEYKGAWHQAARTLGVPTAPAWFDDLLAAVRPGVRVGDLSGARVEDLSGPTPFRQLGPDATLHAGQAVAVTALHAPDSDSGSDAVLWGETLLLRGSD